MAFLEFLQYGFIQKAFVSGIFIAILSAVLGTFLVLRRYSMIGDGLSHVSFGAIALGLFLGFSPIIFAVPFSIIGAVLILIISKKARVYGDSAIGIVSSAGISLGVILASINGGFNVDLLSYLFGNILAISFGEMVFSILLSLAVLGIVFIYFNDLFSITFDSEYAKVSGIKVEFLNYLLVILTALTVVLAVRVVGIMLISALLIIPAVSALQVSKGFKSSIVYAIVFSVFSVIAGIIISFFLDLPTGATIVLVNLAVFSFTLLFRRIRK